MVTVHCDAVMGDVDCGGKGDDNVGPGGLVTTIMENGCGCEVAVTWDQARPHLGTTLQNHHQIFNLFSIRT